MSQYTEEQHAVNLIYILEAGDVCTRCPMSCYTPHPSSSCLFRICRPFVGLEASDYSYNIHNCPCNELGAAEAAKRAWLAIEEKHPHLLTD